MKKGAISKISLSLSLLELMHGELAWGMGRGEGRRLGRRVGGVHAACRIRRNRYCTIPNIVLYNTILMVLVLVPYLPT